MRDCIASFAASDDKKAIGAANAVIAEPLPHYHHYEIACVLNGEWRYLDTVSAGFKLKERS